MLGKVVKVIMMYLLIFAICGVLIFFTVKRQNEEWKNTILLISDDNFYNLTYKPQQNKINDVLSKHYTKLITQTYNLSHFKYEDFYKDLQVLEQQYTPTHIIFSPSMVVYLYSYNAEREIGKHKRGRAKLIGLTRINRTGTLDDVYNAQGVNKIWDQIGTLADAQTEEIAFVYNSSDNYSRDAYNAFTASSKKTYTVVDEYPRDEGVGQSDELYDILFNEHDTKIIITPYFKNLSLLANRLNREKKDTLFITDIEMTIPLGQSNKDNIGAVSDIRLDEIIDDILNNVSFSDSLSTEQKEGKRYIYITNDRIKVIENGEFIR